MVKNLASAICSKICIWIITANFNKILVQEYMKVLSDDEMLHDLISRLVMERTSELKPP